MLAEQGIEFAGHGRDKIGDLAAFNPDPLGVGAGQTKEAGLHCRGQGTKDLHLFAAHHIGPMSLTHGANTRHDPDTLGGLYQTLRNGHGISRTVDIGRCHPAEIRPRHTAEQNRQAFRLQSRSDVLF